MGLKDVLGGDLDSWEGLTGSETLNSLRRELAPLKHVYHAMERTRTYQRYKVTVFERFVSPHLVKAWFALGSSKASLIEYDDPPIQNVEYMMEACGEPELILSDKRYAPGAIVREYVYARRGLTLSVAEPFASSVNMDRRIIHLQLFPPSTLESYMTDIGLDSHPFPRMHL